MFDRFHARLPLLCGVLVLSALPLFSQPVPQANLPEPDEFIVVETEPVYDRRELMANTVYPEMARRQGIEGMVLVRALVNKSGEVVNMAIDEAVHPLLDSAATSAIRKTRFTPAMQGGEPIAVWIQIPMVFRFNDRVAASEPAYSNEELAAKVVYPEAARRLNVEGTVIVQVHVGTGGEVLATRIERCDHELLCESARKTVAAVTFKPAMEGDRPVSKWVRVPVHFRLN